MRNAQAGGFTLAHRSLIVRRYPGLRAHSFRYFSLQTIRLFGSACLGSDHGSLPYQRSASFPSAFWGAVEPSYLSQFRCLVWHQNSSSVLAGLLHACWFLDLDTPGIYTASSYRLAEQVESLASLIRNLTRRLRASTKELARLTANRPSGALAERPGNNHLVLQNYRLGHYNLRQTAEWLGIRPYSSKTGKGTRDWKARVRQRLKKGKEFEDEHYPRAVAVFANRDHADVRRKARRAYRGYRYEVSRGGRCSFSLLGYWAQVSRPETKRGKEIAFAYLQLGSCILQRIPPIP